MKNHLKYLNKTGNVRNIEARSQITVAVEKQ